MSLAVIALQLRDLASLATEVEDSSGVASRWKSARVGDAGREGLAHEPSREGAAGITQVENDVHMMALWLEMQIDQRTLSLQDGEEDLSLAFHLGRFVSPDNEQKGSRLGAVRG